MDAFGAGSPAEAAAGTRAGAGAAGLSQPSALRPQPRPQQLRAPAASVSSIKKKINNNGSHAASSILAGEARHEPSRQLSQNRVALKSLAILLVPAPGAGHQAPCHLTCRDSSRMAVPVPALREPTVGEVCKIGRVLPLPPKPRHDPSQPVLTHQHPFGKSNLAHPAGIDWKKKLNKWSRALRAQA